MKHLNSDFMIYTRKQLSEDEFVEIASRLREMDGITRFERSES